MIELGGYEVLLEAVRWLVLHILFGMELAIATLNLSDAMLVFLYAAVVLSVEVVVLVNAMIVRREALNSGTVFKI